MKALVLVFLFVFSAPVFAECIPVDRSAWPEKYKGKSVSGAVSMIAAESGIDPFLPGGKVWQDGFSSVCVENRNPAFDMETLTAEALLEKIEQNEAFNELEEAEIKAKVRAFDSLTENEKLELIREKIKEK